MLLRQVAQAARKWVFFSQRLTLPNMPSTLISGVRGVMCYNDALGRMGVFFARTGPKRDYHFIIAIVVIGVATMAVAPPILPALARQNRPSTTIASSMP